MQARLNMFKANPAAMQALLDVSEKLGTLGLEHSLLELVKMRASQINGCANCLAMHAADARKSGETEMRLYLLSAWWESSLYTDRERAALAWTDSLTKVAETQAPDSVYAQVAAQFTEAEQVALTLAITIINSWNRFAVGFRVQHAR
ncbi:carboxymuconolactone decarboxylase family protein [Lacibacterium aquatile]|uniref:Carboxymuconolactone decarboxylase family protein n=1 Tax=Lacibacterium aquatile TaxID=1168082 RepID=A0ABW5DM94_9PROT